MHIHRTIIAPLSFALALMTLGATAVPALADNDDHANRGAHNGWYQQQQGWNDRHDGRYTNNGNRRDPDRQNGNRQQNRNWQNNATTWQNRNAQYSNGWQNNRYTGQGRSDRDRRDGDNH